jgi:hypothetical protein
MPLARSHDVENRTASKNDRSSPKATKIEMAYQFH